jgi:hypothetical protein
LSAKKGAFHRSAPFFPFYRKSTKFLSLAVVIYVLTIPSGLSYRSAASLNINISPWLRKLNYGQYVFTCVFEDCAMLPSYKGSTLRGVFGHALKKVVCALRNQECAHCLLCERCIYPTIFEISSNNLQIDGRKRIAHPPHPYVIEPPMDTKTRYQKGDQLDFSLLLFGDACENLPYFIYAFEQIGSVGLGVGKHRDGRKGTFTLQKVCANREVIYSKSDGKIQKQTARSELVAQSLTEAQKGGPFDIELEFLSPLRLKYHNGLKAELPFEILTRAMLRRISSLFQYHGEGEPALDYRGLVARAQEIAVKESHISWHDWRRYSNRQEQAMMMGGMVGKILYADVPGEYLPLLRFCELAHLGKQTTFGLGKIQMRMVNGG